VNIYITILILLQISTFCFVELYSIWPLIIELDAKELQH